MKRSYSMAEVNSLAKQAGDRIQEHFGRERSKETLTVYPVPRGGIPALFALMASSRLGLVVTDHAMDADFIFDDLIDTGRTMERFYGKPFFALIDKRTWHGGRNWVVWPWEGDAESGIVDNVTRLLQFIGEDPTRGGLKETPARVARAWQFWCSGYDKKPEDVLKTFEDGVCDEMVMVKDIPFYSHCEHHMALFFGTATIAYLPQGKIVGLSKLPRLLDIFAQRLQVQERLTTQVADAIMEHLKPQGVGVVIKARHMCMESRGIQQQGHHTVTSALRGAFKDEPAARSEFLRLAGR